MVRHSPTVNSNCWWLRETLNRSSLSMNIKFQSSPRLRILWSMHRKMSMHYMEVAGLKLENSGHVGTSQSCQGILMSLDFQSPTELIKTSQLTRIHKDLDLLMSRVCTESGDEPKMRLIGNDNTQLRGMPLMIRVMTIIISWTFRHFQSEVTGTSILTWSVIIVWLVAYPYFFRRLSVLWQLSVVVHCPVSELIMIIL